MINAWQILRLYAVIHLFHKSYFEPSKHFYIKRIGYSTDITRLRTGYIYIHTHKRAHIHTCTYTHTLYTLKLFSVHGKIVVVFRCQEGPTVLARAPTGLFTRQLSPCSRTAPSYGAENVSSCTNPTRNCWNPSFRPWRPPCRLLIPNPRPSCR